MSKDKLHNSNKKEGFKLPEGYFDSFGDKLFDKLQKPESSLPKHDGMSVPKGYFEDLEDKLSAKIDVSNIPSKDGMKVPEGYFSSIEERLSDKLKEKTTETKVVQLRSFKKYYYAISGVAAAALLFFAINFFGEESLPTLTETDIEYFINSEFSLNSYEIAEVFNNETLDYSEIINEQYTDEEVIDFLNENIDDVEDYIYEMSQNN